MTSFFQDQQFPPNNWHRMATPGGLSLIGSGATDILAGHLIAPGANNAQGEFVPDVLTVSPVSLYV
jgi:hypothetical protein